MGRSRTAFIWLWLGLGIATGCSSAGPGPAPDIQAVDVGGFVGGQVLVDGETLWIVVDADPEDFRASQIAKFDTASASIAGAAELPAGIGGFMGADGNSIWMSGGDPLPGVLTLNERFGLDRSSSALWALNTTEMMIDRQILLDSIYPNGLAVSDGYAWTGTNFLQKSDLGSGEATRGFGTSEFNADQLQVLGGSLWWVDRANITKVDASTGDQVFQLAVDGSVKYPEMRLKFYEGRFLVSGASQGEPGVSFVLDPDSGELSESVPADGLPTLHFESDTIRWELYNNWWDQSRWDPVREEDVWRRVDVGTGEALGEYRFDEYVPIAELNDSLWLRGPEGLGQVEIKDLASG